MAVCSRWPRPPAGSARHAPPDALVLASNRHATTLAFLADRRVLSGRELENLPAGAVPAATWFLFAPLDARARAAADAAGLTPGAPAGPSLRHAQAAARTSR